MQLIYIHGLNSDHTSEKGFWLQDWYAKHVPYIKVVRPNLNMPPLEAIEILNDLIMANPFTGLVASSLGGFYAHYCANQHNCKAVLLNPSMQPFNSMRRYFTTQHDLNHVGHITPAGWHITKQHLLDMQQLAQNKPSKPQNFLVMLKQADEVLDYKKAQAYFSQPDAQSFVMVEHGGDHYFSNLKDKISTIHQFLFAEIV